jgi:transposase-like protein
MTYDWQALADYLQCPVRHRKRIRTTKLLERSLLEERRRTKVIARFITKKGCFKLVFATRRRATHHWQGVMMSELEWQ